MTVVDWVDGEPMCGVTIDRLSSGQWHPWQGQRRCAMTYCGGTGPSEYDLIHNMLKVYVRRTRISTNIE